jgi:hypothetical protein
MESSLLLNLHQMRKEARILLHGLQQRDSTALRRYYSIDPLAGRRVSTLLRQEVTEFSDFFV